MSKYEVTIIIPMYNSQLYIEETLESIEKQTVENNIEVLIINDGSEDKSVEIAEKYIKTSTRENIKYKIINDGKNLGQGVRRNEGIKKANGETILFLDSDDLLNENAINILYKKFNEQNNIDFVLFEWAFYYPETKNIKYVNKESYNKKLELKGEECETLLSCSTYFSVNKLYRKSFLINQNIAFSEGHLYEDFEFYVNSALSANKIVILPNILYLVRVHDQSSTKSNSDSLIHRDSFLKAIEKTLILLNMKGYRDEYSPYQVSKYFLNRALIYSEKRLPNNKKIREEFLYETLSIFNKYLSDIKTPENIVPLFHYSFKEGIIKYKDVKYLLKIYSMHKKKTLYYYNRRKKKTKNLKNKIKKSLNENYILEPIIFNARRQVHKKRNKNKKIEFNNIMNSKVKKGTILMLGFDYQYRGNSKYLFDYLMNFYSENGLKFVTFDTNVPEEYRIAPRSEEFFNTLYNSQIIIAESWVPLAFRKKNNQYWIQLWHGTPFKKMMFDSTESTLLTINASHKVNKKLDIEKWDYLLSDSSIAAEKLSSAFNVQQEKIVNYGYPRNEWLLRNKDNNELIDNLKIKYNLPLDKKIILYAPTWRDYNYKVKEENKDLEYILNFQNLIEQLNDDYIIINKMHSMDVINEDIDSIENLITLNKNIDTQELILISDLIVTDYSSIIFDAVHINKPFYLLNKDYEKYEESRGVYTDMLIDLKDITAINEEQLSKLINDNTFKTFKLPTSYLNSKLKNSNENILKLIQNLK